MSLGMHLLKGFHETNLLKCSLRLPRSGFVGPMPQRAASSNSNSISTPILLSAWREISLRVSDSLSKWKSLFVPTVAAKRRYSPPEVCSRLEMEQRSPPKREMDSIVRRCSSSWERETLGAKRRVKRVHKDLVDKVVGRLQSLNDALCGLKRVNDRRSRI